MSQITEKLKVKKILRTIPFQNGFHFAMNDKYTGITAASLADFSSKLETINENSILFHYPRGDFQKWIDDILGDKQLTNQMCFIKTEISEEELRSGCSEWFRKGGMNLKG